MNSKHKFTRLTLAFLISETLAFIMTASFVISVFIFPESDSAEFARMSQHLPPRLIDEITGVILNVCAVPVFLLSIFGIVESVRLFKKKEILMENHHYFYILDSESAYFGDYSVWFIDFFCSSKPWLGSTELRRKTQ